MRAVILKEFSDGWRLVLLGVALAVLALVGGTLGPVYGMWKQDEANLLLFFAMIFLPIVLGVLAASSLFAGEFSKGTLPLLFLLPLSRFELWCAKFLAGLALTLAASLALALPLFIALPGPNHLGTLEGVPMVLVWTVLAYSLSLLGSTLSERPINGLMATLFLLLPASLLYTFSLAQFFERRISFPTGEEVFLASGLLLLLVALLTSAAVVKWGELLTRGRKWLLAFAVGLGGLTVAAMILGACATVVAWRAVS